MKSLAPVPENGVDHRGVGYAGHDLHLDPAARTLERVHLEHLAQHPRPRPPTKRFDGARRRGHRCVLEREGEALENAEPTAVILAIAEALSFEMNHTHMPIRSYGHSQNQTIWGVDLVLDLSV